MTVVSIVPIHSEKGVTSYRAIAGSRKAVGRTAGQALDAIAGRLTEDETSTLVVVQHHRPDRFFTAQQQKRLGELMTLWRSARDSNSTLSPQDQAELDALVEAEVQASAQRAAAIVGELGK